MKSDRQQVLLTYLNFCVYADTIKKVQSGKSLFLGRVFTIMNQIMNEIIHPPRRNYPYQNEYITLLIYKRKANIS